MQKGNKTKKLRKPQHQVRSDSEKKLEPPPVFDYREKKGDNKLKNKIALITGADSGIGRAVANRTRLSFLASDDASYITGQFIHPNRGRDH